MHDQDGRVDVIHDKVKALWLRMGQPDGFYREKVPCEVEHYTIPLYTSPDHTDHTKAMLLALEALKAMLHIFDRALPKQSIGRQICNESIAAIAALKGALE